jgi:hypothetical protein
MGRFQEQLGGFFGLELGFVPWFGLLCGLFGWLRRFVLSIATPEAAEARRAIGCSTRIILAWFASISEYNGVCLKFDLFFPYLIKKGLDRALLKLPL